MWNLRFSIRGLGQLPRISPHWGYIGCGPHCLIDSHRQDQLLKRPGFYESDKGWPHSPPGSQFSECRVLKLEQGKLFWNRAETANWRLFSISILQPNVCKEKQMKHNQCFELAPIFHRKWRTLFISETEIATIYFPIHMFCVWKRSKSLGPLVNPFPWGLCPYPFPTVPTGSYWFPSASVPPHVLCSRLLASPWFLMCCANCVQFKALGIKIINSNSTIFSLCHQWLLLAEGKEWESWE